VGRVSSHLGSGCVNLGAFDQLAAFEAGSGADEGDRVGRVHGPPPLLGGLDEFEDHREGGSAGAGAAGDLGPKPDRGEGGLDGVCRAQVDPVLGREVEEGQQLGLVVGDLLDGLGELRAVELRERLMLTLMDLTKCVAERLRPVVEANRHRHQGPVRCRNRTAPSVG
jgi:hypothetical protein